MQLPPTHYWRDISLIIWQSHVFSFIERTANVLEENILQMVHLTQPLELPTNHCVSQKWSTLRGIALLFSFGVLYT